MHRDSKSKAAGGKRATWLLIAGLSILCPEVTWGQDEMGGKTGAVAANMGKLRKGFRMRAALKKANLDPDKVVVVIPVNVDPLDDDKERIKRLIKELEDTLKKKKSEPPGPFSPLPPPPKKPGDPPPPKKPKNGGIKIMIPDDLIPLIIRELEKLKKIPVKTGPGGIVIKPLPGPPPPNAKLPSDPVLPRDPNGGVIIIEDDGNTLYRDDASFFHTYTYPLFPGISPAPVIQVVAFSGDTLRSDVIISFHDQVVLEYTDAAPPPLPGGPGDPGSRALRIDGDDDGEVGTGLVVNKLKSQRPPHNPSNDQAAVFPEDGNEWFATLGGGVQHLKFGMTLKPIPPAIGVGKLPDSATKLPSHSNRVWDSQTSDQRPQTRIRYKDGKIVIDPRSDLERSKSEYRKLLAILDQTGGRRGYESDSISNFALMQDLDPISRSYDYDEDSFYGSVMFGYRSSCCSFSEDTGASYWQSGLTFSWMDGVDVSTPWTQTLSGDVTINYNTNLNNLRPMFTQQFQPISRIGLLGYQSASLDLDSQALALFFGVGHKFPCGCRLALNLLAGSTFQQWDLVERQRVVANGKRILDSEQRSSGNNAIPTLSGSIEAAYPLTKNTEIVIYGGTILAMGDQGRHDSETVSFGVNRTAWDNRFFGLGISVRF